MESHSNGNLFLGLVDVAIIDICSMQCLENVKSLEISHPDNGYKSFTITSTSVHSAYSESVRRWGARRGGAVSVSYTHLTLPTILRV